MVYGMFFLGGNFVSNLLFTLKHNKPLKTFVLFGPALDQTAGTTPYIVGYRVLCMYVCRPYVCIFLLTA